MNRAKIKRWSLGVAMTEFVIIAPVLLLLGLSAMQLALLYQANNIVSYATFEAARKGAVNHGNLGPMRRELGKRIAPLFGGDGSANRAHVSILRGMAEAFDPRYTKITVLNPTKEAFATYGVDNGEGIVEIPNTYLQFKPRTVDSISKVSIHDANLLRIQVTYAYRLDVPFVGHIVTATLAALDPSQARYYLLGRVPLKSIATVRMQTPARENGSNVSLSDFQ